MKFKEVFRGYDKKQVDDYVVAQSQKNEEILSEQRDRIIHLAEENYVLSEKIKKYQHEEEQIARALVNSQKVAQQYQDNAEKFSTFALQRAKVFYATWQTYAKTICDQLTSQQMQDFNALSKKIEKIIVAYEGKKAVATLSVAEKPQQAFENPIKKVEQAVQMQHSIDLKELQDKSLQNDTETTLMNLCKDLGV